MALTTQFMTIYDPHPADKKVSVVQLLKNGSFEKCHPLDGDLSTRE